MTRKTKQEVAGLAAAYLRDAEGVYDPAAVHIDPSLNAFAQTEGAIDEASRVSADYLHWPWPSLTGLTGGMTGGQVWFIAAFRGKTLFIINCVDQWVNAGLKCYVMSLETTPERFRLLWAGLSAGMDASGALNDRATEAEKARLRTALRAYRDNDAIAQQLVLHPARFLSPETVREALAKAKQWGADVFIVDHVDHLRPDPGQNTWEQSLDAIAELHDQALSQDIVVLATTQLNERQIQSKNRLSRFAPPMQSWVHYGNHKQFTASGMLGLFRPMRLPHADEDPKAYENALQMVRDGSAEPQTILMPNCLGIALMKSRYGGAEEGRQVRLRLDHGRLSDYDWVSPVPSTPIVVQKPSPVKRYVKGPDDPMPVPSGEIVDWLAVSCDRGVITYEAVYERD